MIDWWDTWQRNRDFERCLRKVARKSKRDAHLAAGLARRETKWKISGRKHAIKDFERAVKSGILSARRNYRNGGTCEYIGTKGWKLLSEKWGYDPAAVAAPLLPQGWVFKLTVIDREDGARPHVIRVFNPTLTPPSVE